FLGPLNGQSLVSPQQVQQEVDKIFSSLEGQLAPGAAVLVVKDKEIILNKGYGYANLEAKSPITPETRFDLASVAKQFTGYAIALLIERGELSETDEVRQYIPDLPDFGQTITIGHLLHHTSGLRDWTSILPLMGRSFDDAISMDHILRMVYQQKGLNFEPGSEYTYSNTGYNMLAEIVQRVSGISFREWTDKNIFQPLGMEQTFFLDDHQEVIPNRAHSYFKRGDLPFLKATNLLTAVGSSSLFSSTTDLSLWVSHLLHPAAEFKPAVERMFQTELLNDGNENNYAYGISKSSFRGTNWISHSGSWAAFRTYLVLLPAYDLAVVVLNNNDRSAYQTARRIASLYVAEPDAEDSDESLTDAIEVALSKQTLDEFTGTYRLGKAWYVHLTRDGDKLWTQATDEDIFPMKAIADSVF
ncbi:MAG: serine hydrolase domain-containing protein, partial [Bacteroidota bacterium]